MNFYNLDEVRSLPILEVCSMLGVEVEKKGSSSHWCKLRPGEKTASCKLYLGNGNEYDSFCDFGNCKNGGDVIKFASEYLGCSWQDALEQLASSFNIAPINNTQYMNRNELTDLEYRKIGVYGDLATKNFDFDFDKFSLESIEKYSEKYAMPVEQLRKDYPQKYVWDIIKKRAIPHVYGLRNDYYFALYCCLSIQKSLTGHFDINNVPHKDLQELIAASKELTKAEQLLKKALRGTDVRYSQREYNVLEDLKKINYGEISFEIGDKTYADMKRESKLYGVDLRYRSVSVDSYFALKNYGLEEIAHAGFLQNEKVNIVFLPDQGDAIDRCIRLEQTNTRLSNAVAIDYKGVVFDFWSIDDDGEVVAMICEHCLQNAEATNSLDGVDDFGSLDEEIGLFKRVVACEEMSVCAVKNCNNEGSRYYQVALNPMLIEPLSYEQMQEREKAAKAEEQVAAQRENTRVEPAPVR